MEDFLLYIFTADRSEIRQAMGRPDASNERSASDTSETAATLTIPSLVAASQQMKWLSLDGDFFPSSLPRPLLVYIIRTHREC